MLAVPWDLDEAVLAAVVERGWGIGVASMGYLPVGWGSHHWKVAGDDGAAWFVTVDELENKRVSASESVEDGFARLRAALSTAVALRSAGQEFVVAPVPTGDGESVVRFAGRFAVAVYPFTEGRSFGWGEWSAERRVAALGMVAAVHAAPAGVRAHALADGFGVPFREEVEAVCSGGGGPAGGGPAGDGPAGDGPAGGGPAGDGPAGDGPYTHRVVRLLREHATGIRRLFDQYDERVAAVRALPGRNVLTHGEPHPGNIMLTSDGWRLIDWDTVAVAPPERDLWHLDPDDATLDAYAAMTGVAPLPELIGLYRLGWDIKDMAYDTARFLRAHRGDADDAKSWRLLKSLVERAEQAARYP